MAVRYLAFTWQPSISALSSSGQMTAGEAFLWMDHYLDRTRLGPMFLREAEVVRIVLTSLKRGVELGHYELRAHSIMAKHVHALLHPKVLPLRLLQSLKGATAREVNRHLNRTREPFWQAESYDHWVRDTAELERIAAYIESNPVKAGLVAKPEDYRWSSAWRGAEAGFAEIPCVGAAGVDTSVDAAGTSACATEQHRCISKIVVACEGFQV